MAKGTRKGRPAGEVHAGVGVDEKMKGLSEVFTQRDWSFKTESHGVIDGAKLLAMATEQEDDNKVDSNAYNAYLQVHGNRSAGSLLRTRHLAVSMGPEGPWLSAASS